MNMASPLLQCMHRSGGATPTRKRQRSSGTRVRFDEELVKKHDGLAPGSRMVYDLLSHVVVRRKALDAEFLGKLTHAIPEIQVEIKQLILVLMDQPTCPMMLRGGGTRSYKLSRRQLPVLVKLYEVLAKVRASSNSAISNV